MILAICLKIDELSVTGLASN